MDDSGNLRYCQPDGILLTINRQLVIFEIKIRFGAEAWYQLEELYKPVVEAVFGQPVTACVVVCKHFDPSVVVPAPVRLLARHTIKEIHLDGKMGVMQWIP